MITTNHKLDAVLGILYKANENTEDVVFDGNRKDLLTSHEIGIKLQNVIPNNELNLILFHLAMEEKYILEDVKYYNGKADNVPSFRILFSGKLFIENGGYLRKRRNEILKNWAYKVNIFVLCAAAIVATIYYTHELLKNPTPQQKTPINIVIDKKVLKTDSL